MNSPPAEVGSTNRQVGSQREADTLLDAFLGAPAGSRIASVAVPAPSCHPAALAALDDLSFVWAQGEQTAWVGLGCARRYSGSGASRFEQIRTDVNRDWRAAFGPAPRAFGGFAFAAGQDAPAWTAFGDACFVLPRLSYERSPATTSLTLTVTDAELAQRDELRQRIAELLALRDRLQTLPTPKGVRLEPSAVVDIGRAEWAALVSDIFRLLDGGTASKVVAARQAEYHFTRDVSLASTLQALLEHAHGSTRFALCQGDVAFVGATPERLITKRGSSIETEALAGTFHAARALFAEELLRSPKEHSEHAPVLEAIVERLRPWCRTLEFAERPELRELPDLLHLCSPIRGELALEVDVLALVERLHPTPAVGGVPTETAVRWILEHEPRPRGWYAGPIGWFDAQGDGEFWVALRSGLLRGSQATLFAGGGIVRGSEAATEYVETDLKLRALYGSLRFE